MIVSSLVSIAYVQLERQPSISGSAHRGNVLQILSSAATRLSQETLRMVATSSYSTVGFHMGQPMHILFKCICGTWLHAVVPIYLSGIKTKH